MPDEVEDVHRPHELGQPEKRLLERLLPRDVTKRSTETTSCACRSAISQSGSSLAKELVRLDAATTTVIWVMP